MTFSKSGIVKTFSDFRSPVLGATNKKRCLKFHYFLKSVPVGGQIEVYLEDPWTGNNIKSLENDLAATRGETWTMKSYSLDLNKEYRVCK